MLKQCLLRPQTVAFVINQTPLRSSHLARLGSTRRSLWRTFSSTNNNDDVNNDNKPRLSVAVVGAGPAGFYASKYLTSSVLKRIAQSTSSADNDAPPTPFAFSGIDIDLIERLPTPYGLVRYGVAPDHPEVKNVENDFAALFNKQGESQNSSINFYGNVDVGKQIPLSKLQSLYDVVILAYGCQAADKRLNIPGEDTLEGVLSAREFVAWYNGHPEFQHIGPIVERCLWKKKSNTTNDDDSTTETSISPARVVVIGQGNVALDVARVLAKGKPGLIDTDTPTSVLNVLKGGVSHVSVVGRRGHVQGAFTIKELRELTKLDKEGHNVSFVVRKEELEMGMTDASMEELKGPGGRPKSRIDKLLQDNALEEDAQSTDAEKSVEIRFLLNPTQLAPHESNVSKVGHVLCERTRLEGDPEKQRPVGTGEMEELPADLVLVSIGYRGMPLEGWIKRGPTGIIGTNIMDAKDTVKSVMNYLETSVPVVSVESQGRDGLNDHLDAHDVKAIDWNQFLRIVSAEIDTTRLRSKAQPREKILAVSEMLNAAQR
eukprot:scaffold832_cov75-Skeletonema_dohrnii-CCMP3373.AAC.5